jgi:hypothetical protein
VLKLIEEGEEDSGRALIEANYEVLMEELESGYKSMDQIAMLDILAQLRLSLGEFEEAEYLLDKVCLFLDMFSGKLRSVSWFSSIQCIVIDST